MAKYEKHLTGNFDELLELVTDGVLNGSMSASYENGSDWTNGTVRCAVRVFERYSYMGGNRVSMNGRKREGGEKKAASASSPLFTLFSLENGSSKRKRLPTV